MLQAVLERRYRKLGPRYLERSVFLQQQFLYPILIAAVAYVSRYVDMSLGEFLRIALVGCGFQLLYSGLTVGLVRRLSAPIGEWLRGARGEESTIAAWRAAASFPRELLWRGLFGVPQGVALWLFFLAWSLYLAWELELPVESGLLVYLAAVVMVAYGGALRFFGAERIVRPVLEDIQAALPAGFRSEVRSLPLRTRLLLALPAINVITAFIAYGIARGRSAELGELAAVLMVAIAVTATLSLLLTILLSSSITEPVEELREAAGRVGEGDFASRVHVLAADEIGELAQAFNQMSAGLAERERIREAFGTYVDRDVAEHILREGTDLAGEEVEVTMMFIDVRGFTAFAERSSAPEVVAAINRLFERAVPIVHAHGGHVDKFVGDGLLAVFGAPRRQDDHADQALAVALEIERAVREELAGELEIGIGLNSGIVVAGNVGGAGRLEFSVIGDAVNVAARVETATRKTGDAILVAESTVDHLRDSAVRLEPRVGIELKGKREAVTLYAANPSRMKRVAAVEEGG